MTLMRLRRNATFAELGEDFGLAASTAWGYFQEIATMLGELLAVDVDDLAESVKGKVCLVDGTLVTGVQLAPPQGSVLRQAPPVRDERPGRRRPARLQRRRRPATAR
jgi:hypothetical protein